MNRIERKINQLLDIFEKEKWEAVRIEIAGDIEIKIVLYKPTYKFLERKGDIQLYDKMTKNKVLIHIFSAGEIEINKKQNKYEILLNNGQYVKMKIY